MGTKHLTYFKVENFKRFDSLEVTDIGQFNLIVGDNNVGKTTLLESLLFDDENYDNYLYNLWCTLFYKNIVVKESNNINFTKLFNNGKPLIYDYLYSNDTKLHHLIVTNKIGSELSVKEIDEIRNEILFQGQKQYLVKFELNNISELKFVAFYDTSKYDDKYCPFIGFNANYDNDLVVFFSKVAISTSKLENLKTQLKYLIPDLTSIEISNAVIPKTLLIAVRESNIELAQPLAQYGDGVIKLFRYLLEIEMSENKRIMIDEIDTGIHYSRMKEFLKIVLKAAKNRNVQIFATTHSKECLEYFRVALEELGWEENGRIIRIADTRSGIKSFTLNYDQFENAFFAEREIR